MRKKKLLFLSACFVPVMMVGAMFCYKHRVGIYNRIRTAEILVRYDGEKTISETVYSGEVNSEKRYLALGFDDFRMSDFTVVLPILEEYQATATFNRIAQNTILSNSDIALIDSLMNSGSYLGDHTWFHQNFLYTDPLFNGQNPNQIEGEQIPFPSNEQMREDRGDGKNVFGFDLQESVDHQLSDWRDNSGNWTAFETVWGELTDEQCQIIRNCFSIYRDTTGMLDKLDELSNRYLGTKGSSAGSWDENLQCYTGGIFAGCKTSSNHEIWERILDVTEKFYQEQYSTEFRFQTWSWPGANNSPFKFEKDGKLYFDEDCKLLYNNLARFQSSRLVDEKGNPLNRSWTDVLRGAGYFGTHDAIYPSRVDGTDSVMMTRQLFFNADLSRIDALAYPTNRTISYTRIAEEYSEKFFDSQIGKSDAAQMYEAENSFFDFIESIRRDTSNGLIHGEVIDSEDTYSEKIFLRQVLEYCKQTGVEVISKEQAYDICFRHREEEGNLIYNPSLRNTAKEFLPDADNVPENPDGYVGDCHVEWDEDGKPCLVTKGETRYLHYGIPLGNIQYHAEAKGTGRLSIFAVKNADASSLNLDKLEKLAECEINSDTGEAVELSFEIPDNEMTEYEEICEGMGSKVMGVLIVYSSDISVKNLNLEKVS